MGPYWARNFTMRSACSGPTPGSLSSSLGLATFTRTRSGMATSARKGRSMVASQHLSSMHVKLCLDAGGLTGPVRLAQQAFDQLARGVPREIGVERHLARGLVVGHVRAAEGDDGLGGEDGAGSRLDGRVHALAPLRIRHAEDRGVLHVGVTVQDVLDLGRVDVDAARDDHVALAIADVD